MTAREIRPATHSDLVRYHGHDRFLRSRAWVALLDGEPVGIAGTFRDAMGNLVLFEEHKPEMEADRALMVRGLLVVRRLLKGITEPLAAGASPLYECSARNLERLGFTHLSGDVYVRPHG
jgi:hypothetical protein